MSLRVQLEITLDQSGAVRKIALIQESGSPSFDVAAIDAVLSAAPFSAPPSHLHSPDGLTRLSWFFYRDKRQCSTSGAAAYIVLNPVAWEQSRGEDGKRSDELVEQVRVRNESRARRAASDGGDQGSVQPAPDAAMPTPDANT
jgi:TonB family protein